MKNRFYKGISLILSVMMMTGAFTAFAEDIPDAAPVKSAIEDVETIENVEAPTEEAIADAPEIVEAETEAVQAKASLKTIKVTKNTTVNLKVHDERQITVASGKKIKSCTSSKKSVVIVEKTGFFAVVGAGTAKITVKLTNGKKYTLTVKGTWATPKSIKITAEGSTSIKVKGTLQLTATLTPENANPKVTWSSSNKSVATVSSKGIVTGKKSGTCTITVKTSNGKKANVKIKVTKRSIKELSGYMGESYKTMMKDIDSEVFLNDDNSGTLYITDENANANFTSNGIIEDINTYSAYYSIYGVTMGMSYDKAISTLKAAGFTEDEIGKITDGTNGVDFISFFGKDKIYLNIGVTDNKVVYVFGILQDE